MGELGPDGKKFRGHKHTYGRRVYEIAKESEYCQKRGGPRTGALQFVGIIRRNQQKRLRRVRE